MLRSHPTEEVIAYSVVAKTKFVKSVVNLKAYQTVFLWKRKKS